MSDATVQLQVISQLADPITPFRVIGPSAYLSSHTRGEQGHAELQSLIHSVLAGLKPREAEAIELSFTHDLRDDDLAIALGLPPSRAYDLAARARGRLEEGLSALHIALTGRKGCPVLGELLADWDGQLTEQTRELVVWHIGECQTCARHGLGAMRPAAFLRLMPLAPLPEDLREQVLRLCTSTAADAMAYRRRVARRAERIWLARFSQAIRLVSWSGIRAHPGVAIAIATVVVWLLAAVTVTMLTFTGSGAAQAHRINGSSGAHAQPPGTNAENPAAAATAVTSAPARPSPAVTQSRASRPAPVQPVQSAPSRLSATSPAPSHSSRPSKKPSRSASPSPTPSRSASSSPAPTHPASPPPSSTSPPA